jgi:hypothetical protein
MVPANPFARSVMTQENPNTYTVATMCATVMGTLRAHTYLLSGAVAVISWVIPNLIALRHSRRRHMLRFLKFIKNQKKNILLLASFYPSSPRFPSSMTMTMMMTFVLSPTTIPQVGLHILQAYLIVNLIMKLKQLCAHLNLLVKTKT